MFTRTHAHTHAHTHTHRLSHTHTHTHTQTVTHTHTDGHTHEPPPLSPSPAPVTPPPKLENDASFAQALQEEEDAQFKESFMGGVSKRRSKKPVAGVMESHDPTDAGYGYSALDPSPGKAFSELPGFYHQESDQLRAKTPPPATPTDDCDKAEKIPCQFCSELIPFEEIMEHQVSERSAAVGEGEG